MGEGQSHRQRLREWLEEFSDEQVESLYHYGEILEKAFSRRRGPMGQIIAGWMRMDHEVIDERTMVFRLPLRWEMYNGLGIVHGGVLATLVDNAMGWALYRLYPGKIIRQVTANLHIHYLRGAKGKELWARTTLLQAGKRLAVLEAAVKDEDENLVCAATGTFRIFTEATEPS